MKRPKYRNRKVTVGDMTFDSAGEYRRWCELKLLEKAGAIRNLERQVRVPLVVNGVKVCELRPDFSYFQDQHRVHEEFKGFPTRDWKIKWKLASALFPSMLWCLSPSARFATKPRSTKQNIASAILSGQGAPAKKPR